MSIDAKSSSSSCTIGCGFGNLTAGLAFVGSKRSDGVACLLRLLERRFGNKLSFLQVRSVSTIPLVATTYILAASSAFLCSMSLAAELLVDGSPGKFFGSKIGDWIVNLSNGRFFFDVRHVQSHSAETTGM